MSDTHNFWEYPRIRHMSFMVNEANNPEIVNAAPEVH